MGSSLGYSVDITAFAASLKAFSQELDIVRRVSELAVAHEVLRLSQFEVPHDKGFLQNSGAVEEYEGDVVVGYHAPYAARLHEHPEYRFQKGRKGKYLEDPIVKNESALGLVFVKNIEDNIKQ